MHYCVMINPPKNAPKNVIFSQKRKFGDFSSFLGKFLGTQKRVNHGLYRHFVNLPKNRIWEIFYVTVQIDFLFFLRFCAKIFCTFECLNFDTMNILQFVVHYNICTYDLISLYYLALLSMSLINGLK